MKTCDLCNGRLGLMKFRYKDGFVCRACYEKLSRGCTETIRQMDLAELKLRYRQESEAVPPVFDDFEITGRIGNYILMDDRQKKICIVNNRLQVREHRGPEILSLNEIRYFKAACGSSLTWDELCAPKGKTDGTVKFLELRLFLTSEQEPRHIRLLSSPARINSFAFQKTMDFARLIIDYLSEGGAEFKGMV